MHTKIALFILLAASSVSVFSAPVSSRSLGAELDTDLTVGGGPVDLGAVADVGGSVSGDLAHESPENDNQDHHLEDTETNYRRSACDINYKKGGASYIPTPSKRNPICVTYKKGGVSSSGEPHPSKRQYEHLSREPKNKQSIGGGHAGITYQQGPLVTRQSDELLGTPAEETTEGDNVKVKREHIPQTSMTTLNKSRA